MSEQTLREALREAIALRVSLFRHSDVEGDTDGMTDEQVALLDPHAKQWITALSASVAQPVAQSLLKTVERILDDHSAWVAAPNRDVARAIAIAAGVVAQEMAKEMVATLSARADAQDGVLVPRGAVNLVDRAQKIFLQAVPTEMVTSDDYNPIKAWIADATKFLKETQGR